MKNSKNTQYQSTRHAKFLINYHFIWCPKYRYKILDDEAVRETVKQAIVSKVEELGCSVIALEIMPDHVHLSLSALPRFSPAELVGKIKGASGSRVAARFPGLKKRGKIWSNSYFCATTGSVSTDTIKKYIESQWSRIK